MSFLSPLYLLLASAAAVPVLLHLLRRRIGTRVEFPAARYLARAERENSRRLRLRNLLLMALRIVAVLLVATAAARPVGRVGGTGHAPTALAVVLDNSLSTTAVIDGVSVLDRLRRAARAAVARATASDRVWLVTADGRIVGGGARAVLAALDRLQPIAGRGDPAAALARGVGLVRASGLAAQQVALLTDGQATTWSAQLSLGDASVGALVPDLPTPPNHAVASAEARPVRWTPRGAVVARTIGADSAIYRIALSAPGGAPRTLARGTATGGEIMVRAAPPERGWLAGTVELEPDELRGDDTRYFATWIGTAPGVTVDPSAGPFARNAFSSLVQNERVRAGSDVSIVGGDALEHLPALILAPSDPVRVGAANRALERFGIPWRFGAPKRETSPVRATHGDTAGLAGVSAMMRYPLEARAPASGDTIAVAGTDPWIVAGPRYVIIASPLDPLATTLPVRASFLPLLADLVSQQLVGEVGSVVAATPGAPFRAPAGVQMLEASDGAELPLDPRAPSAPDHAGVYFFRRGSERAGALVVNAEAEESVLRRLTPGEMRGRLQARSVRVETDPTRWVARVFDTGAGRPLAAPLLVAALLALLAEMAVARGRRPAAAASRQAA